MLLPPQFRRDDDCFALGEKILPKKEEQVCKFKEFETKNYDWLLYKNAAPAALFTVRRMLGAQSSPEATVGETYKSKVFGDFLKVPSPEQGASTKILSNSVFISLDHLLQN